MVMNMRVLHYTLGLPPYRTGGLTKYATDLMLSQAEAGDSVALLWPGRYLVWNRKTIIERQLSYYHIENYELLNPKPVPLLNGVKDIPVFTAKGESSLYIDFLRKLCPDVIHVHTLMGIHREFFEAGVKLHIPIIYTAHDYFGLCPKVNFFCKGKVCPGMGNRCQNCNETGLDFWKIVILQSGIYKRWKEGFIAKSLRRYGKKKMIERGAGGDEAKKKGGREYWRLAQYYRSIFYQINIIHYSSTLAKEVFEDRGIKVKGAILPITHRDIQDHRVRKKYRDSLLKITYLGDLLPHKGFQVLHKVLTDMWEEGKKQILLNIFFPLTKKEPFVKIHPRYNYDAIGNIMNHTDVLVVPSLWKETYGFVVLEALSYGVPVIASEYVGAKDWIKDKGTSYRMGDGDLYRILNSIYGDRGILKRWNENICKMNFPFCMDSHVREIRSLYKAVTLWEGYKGQFR